LLFGIFFNIWQIIFLFLQNCPDGYLNRRISDSSVISIFLFYFQIIIIEKTGSDAGRVRKKFPNILMSISATVTKKDPTPF